MKFLPVLMPFVALTAFAAPSPEQLQNVTPQQALKLANLWRTGTTGVKSFVTSEKIQFTFPDGQQSEVKLPADQMVIAIAPYLQQTHPCKTHFMSSCTGELQNQNVQVTVKNGNGKTIIRRAFRTHQNGFLEVWLPRNETYTVTLTAQGKTVTGTLKTFSGSDTCVTNLQLR